MVKNPKIAILSFSKAGGIYEYSIYLATLIKELFRSVEIFLPYSYEASNIINLSTNFYKVNEGYFNFIPTTELEKLVEKLNNFDLVVFTNYNIQLKRLLGQIRTKCLICVHDVIPNIENISILRRIKRLFDRTWIFPNIIRDNHIVVFSEYASSQIQNTFKIKPIVWPLPCHIITRSKMDLYERNVLEYLKNNKKGKVLITFIGRIEPYKGIYEFLKRYCEQENNIRSKFIIGIFGSGKLGENIKKLIDRINNKEENVILINDHVSNAFIEEILAISDYFLATYKKITQSGIVPCAQKMGVTVLSTGLGGLREQYKDGETGITVRLDEFDFEGLIEFIKKVNREKIKEYYSSLYNKEYVKNNILLTIKTLLNIN